MMGFGDNVVVGATAGSPDVTRCDVFARVKGQPQARAPMRPGQVLSADGGDLGFFEVTLLYSLTEPGKGDIPIF